MPLFVTAAKVASNKHGTLCTSGLCCCLDMHGSVQGPIVVDFSPLSVYSLLEIVLLISDNLT